MNLKKQQGVELETELFLRDMPNRDDSVMLYECCMHICRVSVGGVFIGRKLKASN